MGDVRLIEFQVWAVAVVWVGHQDDLVRVLSIFLLSAIRIRIFPEPLDVKEMGSTAAIIILPTRDVPRF